MATAPNRPGTPSRKGISLVHAGPPFGDATQAAAWFVARRGPNGGLGPQCESAAIATRPGKRQTPEYHCKGCGKNFTVKTDTIMHNSKLPLSKWALAFYLYSTHLKGVSSMKLHRDLDITQKAAWHLAHRIREMWNDETGRRAGPTEADETYIGGREKNKHTSKKCKVGRGPVGKTAAVGIKDRETNTVKATVVERRDAPTLQGFVNENRAEGATVYTDEHRSYEGLEHHASVRHSVSEYVKDQAHTNGIESFWAMLKRGYHGTHHHMSKKHLDRYVQEFSGRHNARPLDTAEQMDALTQSMVGKRRAYQAWTAAGVGNVVTAAALPGQHETQRPFWPTLLPL